jgi:dipeptidyl aminopeptidase/acylaminoacyl peptidase
VDAEPVVTAAFADGGRRLILGGAGGLVRQADPATGKVLRRFPAFGEKATTVMFGPGCRLAAFTVGDAAEVRLWDVAAGKELRRLKTPQGISLVGFGPRGRLLAILEGDGVVALQEGRLPTLRLWDTTTGQSVRPFDLATTELTFAPNGKVMAAAEESGITLWEVATGKRRCRLPGASGGSATLAFSPDGRWLAAGGNDEVVRLWDVLTGELRRGLVGHTDGIKALAFSPDGKRLASGSADQTVILWDPGTGELLRRLEGHRGTVQALAFAPDGKRLVSGSDDTTALVWDLQTPPRPKPPTAVRPLEELWADLGRDAGPAFAAHRVLASRPVEAVSFLNEKLAPVAAANPAVIARLIKDLDSRRFAVRERAVGQLARLEGQAERALRQALADHPDAEVTKRLQGLLERLERPVLSPEELRASRALELLEQLNAPGAKQLLRTVAGGAPAARLTREAREALDRSTTRTGVKDK